MISTIFRSAERDTIGNNVNTEILSFYFIHDERERERESKRRTLFDYVCWKQKRGKDSRIREDDRADMLDTQRTRAYVSRISFFVRVRNVD